MTAELSSTRCVPAHRAAVPVLTLCLLAAACGGNNSGDSGAAAARNSERTEAVLTLAAANASFTDADLDAYERGLKTEIAAVEAARREASAAQTAAERAAAAQAEWEDATIPLGAEAAGMSEERYRQLRTTVHEVFSTLDFQGEIDGPLAIDLTQADAATKARIARDPFADLPAESAAALRSQMERLVATWTQYMTLDDPGAAPPAQSGRTEVLAPIDAVEIQVQKSLPVQYAASITSGLPSGCAAFERIEIERNDSVIDITVWNSMPADDTIACTMIYGTVVNAAQLGSAFEPGRSYDVRVNGETKATFIAQ
jgi:hypothetical protein